MWARVTIDLKNNQFYFEGKWRPLPQNTEVIGVDTDEDDQLKVHLVQRVKGGSV